MLQSYLMKQPDLEVIKKVHRLFRDEGLTLSVAESCTGGLISSYLTDLPGASIFFTAGIVSYSDEIKRDILGISPDTILRCGAVSKETAGEMAEKVRLLAKTDYSLSTTGNLGPDVPEGKEQGLVYIAVSTKVKTMSHELRLKGNRNANKEEASVSALKFLVKLVENHGKAT